MLSGWKEPTNCAIDYEPVKTVAIRTNLSEALVFAFNVIDLSCEDRIVNIFIM